MNNISVVVLSMGSVKTGKSYLNMKGLNGDGNTIMIDLTDDSNAKPAALSVYGDEFDNRYFKVDDYEELERILEETECSTVCIDESKDLRDLYAKKYLKEHPKKTKIFPISEWALVYGDIKERIFRKYDSEKNFLISGGLRDVRVYKEKEEKEVITGRKSPDGLNILPALADIIVHVTTSERNAGSPPKVVRSRKIKVLGNRFLDYAGEEWVDEISGLKDLMDRIVDGGRFKREMFLV